jgi:hypothetical protein
MPGNSTRSAVYMLKYSRKLLRLPFDEDDTYDDLWESVYDPCPYDPDYNGSLQKNGLVKIFGKKVICNPPYSHAKIWIWKCFYECKTNRSECVIIVKAESMTRQYFRRYYEESRKHIDIKVHVCCDRPQFGGYEDEQVAPFNIMYVHLKPRRKQRKKKSITLKNKKKEIFKAYQSRCRKIRELESQKELCVYLKQTKKDFK